MKFADVKNDIAFRKIFGNENRKDVLMSFLNAILEFEGNRRITDVTILNPFQLSKFRDGKATVIDVKARDQAGREYIIEMQVAEVWGFSKRVLYYTSQSYVGQIERGEFYEKLNPAIFIGILEFEMTQNGNYISRHQIREVETGERIFEDMEFNLIELPKFKKQLSELNTPAERWIYFIKEAENLEVIPANLDDPALKKAYEEANTRTWSKAELDAYDYASMREQDERGKIELAERRAEEKGLKLGEEKGLKLGEEKSKLQIARQMKADGLPADTISKYTGLSLTEINDL